MDDALEIARILAFCIVGNILGMIFGYALAKAIIWAIEKIDLRP